MCTGPDKVKIEQKLFLVPTKSLDMIKITQNCNTATGTMQYLQIWKTRIKKTSLVDFMSVASRLKLDFVVVIGFTINGQLLKKMFYILEKCLNG